MRRRRRPIRRNKANGSNYIIAALMCLILLNLGVMGIRIVKNKDSKTIKPEAEEKNSVFTYFNQMVKEVINYIPTFKGTNDVIGDNIKPEADEELDELKESKDYLIIDTLDEYESLIIIKDSDGLSTVENIPAPLNIEKIKVDMTKPYIALFHTHAAEGYQPMADGVYYSEDKAKNVIGIGSIITTVLEANNHKTKHIETYHDLPYFNKSYARSLNTINKIKEEEKNIKVFFDVHRDGVDKDAEYYQRFLEKSTILINGVDTATFSLVIGPQTPNYEYVLSFAKYIKAVSDTLYPNLCTGIIIKPYGKFNLYSSNHAALIEIGSNINTVEQANESAKLVGEILSIVMNSLQEDPIN